MMDAMKTRTLILDADDTLWENNIFYERAANDWGALLAAEGFAPHEARETLERIEHARIPLVGYAPEEFARTLVIAYQELCRQHDRQPAPDVEATALEIGRSVLRYPIILLDGVAETMPLLQRHFRLIVLTKGDPVVQQAKVDHSGLAGYLEAVHVVPEKGTEELRKLLAHYGLDPQQTWMVGNSPRSDINPALAVGIGAVYIPYSVPWAFEDQPLADPQRAVTLERFSELRRLFPELAGEA